MFDLSKFNDVLSYRVKLLKNIIPVSSKIWKLFNEVANYTTSEGGKGILQPVISEHYYGYSAGIPPKTVAPKALDLIFYWKSIYGRVEVDRKDFEQMKKDPNADKLAINTLNKYLDIFERSFLHQCNRIAIGDGSAILAVIDSVSNNKVYVKPYYSDETLYPEDAIKFLYKNLVIDIVGSEGYKEQALTIETVGKDENGYFFTTDKESPSGEEGDYVVITGSYNNEPMGILAIVDDGTRVQYYGGKDREEHPLLKATVIRGTAEKPIVLSRGLLLEFWQEMNRRGADKVTHILCSSKVSVKYALESLDITKIVFERRIPRADLGISGYAWTHPDGYEVPVVIDPFLPEGKLIFIDADKLFVSYCNEFEWIKKGDSIFEPVVNSRNEDKLIATGNMLVAMYTNAPNGFGLIENIKVS